MSGRDEKIRLRRRVREVISSLQHLDDELIELSESLPLPLDADEMWEAQLPESFPAYLYAAIETVRTDCLQDAIDTLIAALRQSDVSLRQRFLRASGASRLEMGGISFLQPKTGDDAERKETPPCSE